MASYADLMKLKAKYNSANSSSSDSSDAALEAAFKLAKLKAKYAANAEDADFDASKYAQLMKYKMLYGGGGGGGSSSGGGGGGGGSSSKEYKLTNPNQSLEELIDLIYNAAGTVDDTYVRPDYTDVIDPKILGVDELSNILGVNFTYDRNEIEKIYQDATQAALRSELNSGVERQYYNHLAAAQNTALDTIRQQYGSAVATGANKGMQAANMLSAILGTSQTANDEATQLATDRQQLVNKYAQQMRQDSVDALNYSNDIANTIGGLSHQLYNDMIQQKTAELSYNQGINTDYAGYEASKYTSDSNLKGTLTGVGAGVYNNNQSAIAAIQAAIENAKAQRDAAATTADATIQAAKISAMANR